MGFIVIFGWFTSNDTLTKINPNFVSMQFNTALCFVWSGFGLLSLLSERLKLTALFGLVTVATCSITLSQYIFEFDAGFDQFFIAASSDLYTSHPGRMAPNTALGFIATSLALVCGASKGSNSNAVIGSLASFIFALGFVALGGYLTGINTAYGWGSVTYMAVHTATAFIVVGVIFLSYAIGKNKRKTQTTASHHGYIGP